MITPDSPPNLPRLPRQWPALLLAPAAWACALGILFALTSDSCGLDSRMSLGVVVAICMVLAAASSSVAWQIRRELGDSSPLDRVRLMRGLSLGISATLSVVLILLALPVLSSGTCRP